MRHQNYILPNGWVLHSSYGKRRTAELVADELRSNGWDTRIMSDQYGNQLVYKRRAQ